MSAVKPPNSPTLLPGISSLITATNEMVKKASQNVAPVFITGEMGNEKAFAAKLIHQLSPRADRPISKINISWKLPPDLSQYFEQSSGGTLILHLQKEFPVDMQYTLVELASHGSFADPMTGDVLESDARLIIITSVDPKALGGRTQLLPELKELLEAQHIEIPPLRARSEDIPAVVRYAITRARETGRSKASGADQQVLSLFRQWHWPGNAEELLLVTAQAAIAAKKELVCIEDLPESFIKGLPPDMVEQAKNFRGTQPRPGAGRSDAQTTAGVSSDNFKKPFAAEFTPNAPMTDSFVGAETVVALDAETPLPTDKQLTGGAMVEAPADAKAADDKDGDGKAALSPRMLQLARRLNAQSALLAHQFQGPLDSISSQLNGERSTDEVQDSAMAAALEKELDRGLDLVMALRRQMAVLNTRQRQSAETIKDLLQRLAATGGDAEGASESAADARELTANLKTIDTIISRVSTEIPQLNSALSGNPATKGAVTSGLFRRPN
ncbi:hypothetical protein BH09SUM1_BH09SUM1_26250 [soil metagenome]